MNATPSVFRSSLSGADKIVVYDLEFTSWEGFLESGWSMPGKHCEIIQIGAIKLDCWQAFEEIDSLDLLVKPLINPVLSEYIMSLTGLSQRQIDSDGIAFPSAFQAFETFCQGAEYVCSNGEDDDILNKNCDLHDILRPARTAEAVDLRPLFSEALGITGYGINSCDLAAHIGLPATGNAHNGLADARGVAAALHHLW